VVLTVPTPRRAGRYQIRVAVRWINPWPREPHGDPPPLDVLIRSYYYTCIEVNGQILGTEARATATAVPGAKGTTQYFATDANLDANDKVGVTLWHSFGADVDAHVRLEIRRLGPKVAELG
jgi:hypothetical protein